MLTITNEADYALLFISLLKRKRGLVPLSSLIDDSHLPRRFIARIAAKLVRGGLLISKEGKIGGYKLAENWKKTNLYDFLSLFEKDLEFVKCQNSDYHCAYEDLCRHKSHLRGSISLVLKKSLKKQKLADIV